jgi:WD40 repeat protein
VFSPDGERLFAGGASRSVVVWSVTTGVEVGRVEAPGDWVNALALSRDGRSLATSGSYGDPAIGFWQIGGNSVAGSATLFGRDATTLSRFDGGRWDAVAFEATGRTVAAGSWDAQVHFFDAKTGAERAALATGQGGRTCSIAFSPDGTILASAADDGTVKLFRAPRPPTVN